MAEHKTQDDLAARVRALGVEPTPDLLQRLRTAIITVAAWKGGVGKTFIGYELAWLLGAILLDLDWDRGGVSRAWGYRHEARTNAPLLDALESGRTPHPLKGHFRADLVPCHPDFVDNQPAAADLASELEKWVAEWQRPTVVDTHPGGVPSTYGAVAAAHLVVVPAVLATRELEALEGMLQELRDYRVLVIPNMVPRIPPESQIAKLERITRQYGVAVGPAVTDYVWIPRRQRRMAITATEPVPLRAQPVVDELTQVAKAVVNHVGRAA